MPSTLSPSFPIPWLQFLHIHPLTIPVPRTWSKTKGSLGILWQQSHFSGIGGAFFLAFLSDLEYILWQDLQRWSSPIPFSSRWLPQYLLLNWSSGLCSPQWEQNLVDIGPGFSWFWFSCDWDSQFVVLSRLSCWVLECKFDIFYVFRWAFVL